VDDLYTVLLHRNTIYLHGHSTWLVMYISGSRPSCFRDRSHISPVKVYTCTCSSSMQAQVSCSHG